MVEFMTLLLGLITGVHEVRLAVVGEVAEVEIQLDGERLEILDGEPWTFDCDFGPLAPHELVAVARDRSGRELDRDRLWINVARSSSEAAMSFTADAAGRPSAVRLSWESIGQRHPRSVKVFFDGEPLPVENPRHVPLPAYDLADFHFVSADVQFADREPTRLEAAFGGQQGSEISSDLTALTVTLQRGGLPRVRDMQSWFRVGGEPVRVHGVERREPQVIVVRDPGAQAFFDRLAQVVMEDVALRAMRPGLKARPGLMDWDPAVFFGASPEQLDKNLVRYAWDLRGLQATAAFGKELSWRFVSPTAAPIFPSGVTSRMFHASEKLPGDSGFLSLTQRIRPHRYPVQAIDATAVAGMLAHASGRPRAVVLMTSGESSGHDQYRAEAVAGYLRAMQVPLFVWTVGDAGPSGVWGEGVRSLGSAEKSVKAFKALEAAVDDLYDELRRQRIVWLEGRFLPTAIEITGAARGIARAGS